MKIRKPEENGTIDCPRCNRPNPVELIYCADPDCIAVLHPGRTTCGGCRAAIPINARFCPECGQPMGFEREDERFTAGGSGLVKQENDGRVNPASQLKGGRDKPSALLGVCGIPGVRPP